MNKAKSEKALEIFSYQHFSSDQARQKALPMKLAQYLKIT
jgi:hypothetical protein